MTAKIPLKKDGFSATKEGGPVDTMDLHLPREYRNAYITDRLGDLPDKYNIPRSPDPGHRESGNEIATMTGFVGSRKVHDGLPCHTLST